MGKPVLIARIKGGLGNQLFAYAAARRLSIVNDAELVLDNVSGFTRDVLYNRCFELHQFSIRARLATPWERMEPFERLRRGIAIGISEHRPYGQRRYIRQEGIDFDPRLLSRKLKGTTYIDGLWQGYGYFADVADVIRKDLMPCKELPGDSQSLMRRIEDTESSVALHLRDFDVNGSATAHNLGSDYYKRAIRTITEAVPNAEFFVFTDNPKLLSTIEEAEADRVTLIDDGSRPRGAFEDLMLMSACRHFITANSTFSWWGAWLGKEQSKIVVAPARTISGSVTAWNFPGLIPQGWTQV